MLEHYPELKSMYSPDDDNTETLYFKDLVSETDAALLWYSQQESEAAKRLAIVDGSFVRTRDGRSLLALPGPVACRETVA